MRRRLDRTLAKLDDPNAVVERVVLDRSAADSNEVLIEVDCTVRRHVTFDLEGNIVHVRR